MITGSRITWARVLVAEATFWIVVAWLFAASGIVHGDELAPPWCKVRCSDGSVGSGALVDKNGDRGLVITAHHVVRDVMRGQQQAGTVACEFRGGLSTPGTIVSIDPENDLCAIAIPRPNAMAVMLAPYDGKGTHTFYGFRFGGNLSPVSGRVVRDSVFTRSPGGYYIAELSSPSVEGESGAAVVTDRGMVGLMWGCDEQIGSAQMTLGKPFDNFCRSLTQCYSCFGGRCWQPSQYYTPGGVQVQQGGGKPIDSDPSPIQQPPAQPTKPQPTADEIKAGWIAYIDSRLAEIKQCECDDKQYATEAELEALSLQVTALAKSSQTLAENVAAISQSNATINQTIEAMQPYVPPTPQQTAEQIAPFLKHSATITLLDGSKKTQTKPLSEPLDFVQHSRGVK